MAKIIALTNQKGGVSKTSTTHITALALQESRKRTLIIDMDPQCNLTLIAGARGAEPTLYDVLRGTSPATDAIVEHDGLSVIPGSPDLAGADQLFTMAGREYLLREAIKPLEKKFDVILIDCPPGIGVLTMNALTAANSVLIPCGADLLSIQGFSQIYDLIASTKKYSNKKLQISGIVITRHDARTKLGREFTEEIDEITKRFKIYRYQTRIREGAAVKKYQANDENPLRTYRRDGVIQDYLAFVEELKTREKI